MNQVQILFFATLKDVVGVAKLELSIPDDSNVAILKEKLIEKIPKLEAALPNAVISVNQNFALDDMLIPQNAEIAIFPPVSGGGVGNISQSGVTANSIDLNQIVNQLISPQSGAVCLFVGVVRGVTYKEDESNDHRETKKLSYEAYQPMADAKIKQIENEIREKFPAIQGVSLLQKVGELNCGEMTVVVACSAAHRNDGVFEASRYGIDRIKQIVPVWKKEFGSDGSFWVEGDYIPQQGD